MKSCFKLITIVFIIGSSTGLRAQSAESFWRNAIRACNAATYDNRAIFLGTTNTTGAGSIWNLKHSPVVLATAADYFGSSEKANAALDPIAQPSTCDSSALPSWSVSLGLPVSISGVGNAELDAAIKSAKSITVSINKVWLETMPTLHFLQAIDSIDRKSVYFTQVVDGYEYVLASAVAVDGLTVTYNLSNSLSAGAQAQIAAAPQVTVGSANKPAQAQVSVGNAGTSVRVTIQGTTYVLGYPVRIKKMSRGEIANPNATVTIDQKPVWGS